jgi:hypothetical protein
VSGCRFRLALVFAIAALAPLRSRLHPASFREMRWRAIGPFRGGRTKAIAGGAVAAERLLYRRRQRRRLEDRRFLADLDADLRREPTGSIGAIAVAPSDPNVAHVGSGEGLARPDLSVGDVTVRDRHPVGVEEYGYAVPDRVNADIVFDGKVTRDDRRTGQVQNVAPAPARPADLRTLRTAPIVVSPVDPHVMYFAANSLWNTSTGGRAWVQIRPDPTRTTWDPPSTIGTFRDAETAKATQRGVQLRVNGRSDTQPLTVKMAPRVKTPAIGLTQQFTLSKQVYEGQPRSRPRSRSSAISPARFTIDTRLRLPPPPIRWRRSIGSSPHFKATPADSDAGAAPRRTRPKPSARSTPRWAS